MLIKEKLKMTDYKNYENIKLDYRKINELIKIGFSIRKIEKEYIFLTYSKSSVNILRFNSLPKIDYNISLFVYDNKFSIQKSLYKY